MVIVHLTKSMKLPIALIPLLLFNFALTFPLPLNDHPNTLPLFYLSLPRTTSSITQSASNTSTSGTSTSLTPTHPSFSTVQPQWDLQGISTVVFGCIASVLGVLALLATVWLGRRSAGSAGGTANGTIEGDDLELDNLPDVQDEAATATDQGPVPSDRRLASTVVVIEDKGRSEALRTQYNQLQTALPELSRMPQRVGRREAEQTSKCRR